MVIREIWSANVVLISNYLALIFYIISIRCEVT